MRLVRARRIRRRGVVLMDVILAGLMLGAGLAVMMSLASRTLSQQAAGQKQVVAAWLADELLAMVLVEGPVFYPQLYPTNGRFDPPFEDFEYEVIIDDIGLREPMRVTALVRWAHGRGIRQIGAQTYIAERLGDPLEPRAPLEPIDRLGRYYDDEGF
jgi:hypothetical protein